MGERGLPRTQLPNLTVADTLEPASFLPTRLPSRAHLPAWGISMSPDGSLRLADPGVTMLGATVPEHPSPSILYRKAWG